MGRALQPREETGQRAPRMGCIHQKYVLDEPSRKLIEAVYANPEYGTVTQSINYLQKKLGFSRASIRDYARQLGLCQDREFRWTEQDLLVIEQYHEMPLHKRPSVKSLAQQLGRSEGAVLAKLKRFRYYRTGESYSVRGLADVLGCDYHKVEHWIKQGWLEASWENEKQHQRYITPENARWFILSYRQEIDLRRVDRDWFFDLLVGPEELRRAEKRQKRKKTDGTQDTTGNSTSHE